MVGANMHVNTGTQFRLCPAPYSSLTTAPITGYTAGGGVPGVVHSAMCYVFELVGRKYAAIEIVSYTPCTQLVNACTGGKTVFNYRYQTNGTTALR